MKVSIETRTLIYLGKSLVMEQSLYRDRYRDRRKFKGKYGNIEGREGLLKGSCQALEPHHFLHGGGNAFCER